MTRQDNHLLLPIESVCLCNDDLSNQVIVNSFDHFFLIYFNVFEEFEIHGDHCATSFPIEPEAPLVDFCLYSRFTIASSPKFL